MKTDLAGLKRGDVITAKVSEKLSQFEYIVTISGQLIQVQNHTLYSLEAGSSVNLLVTGVKPLKLQLLPQQRLKKRGLDINV